MFISSIFVLAALQALVCPIEASRHGFKARYGTKAAAKVARNHINVSTLSRRSEVCQVVSPKLFIISMFDPEGDVWYSDENLGLLSQNITVPGFSPLFPDAHCTSSGDICQLTTGEGEINAATTITALTLSKCFDLTKTYFMIAGISGGNPHIVTTGSVTLSRFAVQFDLQYEFDARQIPSNDSTGYFPQNAYYPDSPNGSDYPEEIYGTEVFEVNENLRDRLFYIASLAHLKDSPSAQAYRSTYGYAPANLPPTVVKCDSVTSNNYVSGSILGDALTNFTELMTNGTGTYCGTQQEDNATLEALLRGALAGILDFSRVVIMRTISDFDRAPPDETEVYHLLYADQKGFEISIENIYIAGIAIVNDIRLYWDLTYKDGIGPNNYIGDLFNSLDYRLKPDIGIEEYYINV